MYLFSPLQVLYTSHWAQKVTCSCSISTMNIHWILFPCFNVKFWCCRSKNFEKKGEYANAWKKNEDGKVGSDGPRVVITDQNQAVHGGFVTRWNYLFIIDNLHMSDMQVDCRRSKKTHNFLQIQVWHENKWKLWILVKVKYFQMHVEQCDVTILAYMLVSCGK